MPDRGTSRTPGPTRNKKRKRTQRWPELQARIEIHARPWHLEDPGPDPKQETEADKAAPELQARIEIHARPLRSQDAGPDPKQKQTENNRKAKRNLKETRRSTPKREPRSR